MVRKYVRAFQPTVGFLATDAIRAEYVTAAGPPGSIPQEIDDWLRAGGSKVDRVTGETEAETKELLDKMADDGTRFLSLET